MRIIPLHDEALDLFDEWDEEDTPRRRKLRDIEEDEESIFDMPLLDEFDERPRSKRGRPKSGS